VHGPLGATAAPDRIELAVAVEIAHLGLIQRLMVLTRSRDGEASKDQFVPG
jgi:hypothetical protein